MDCNRVADSWEHSIFIKSIFEVIVVYLSAMWLILLSINYLIIFTSFTLCTISNKTFVNIYHLFLSELLR